MDSRGGVVPVVAALVMLSAVSSPLVAQEEAIPGVTLGTTVADFLPALAVQPFTGSYGGRGVAPDVEIIVARDLRFSDSFEVIDSLPDGLMADGVDYGLWDRLNATWLVTGEVEGAGDGYVLILELHDVVYGELRERGRFSLPHPSDPDFRMAVHRAADELHYWATDEPGIAATRITFQMTGSDGNTEAYVIDSDGENLTQITHYGVMVNSPTWSPDGSRIALASWHSGKVRIYLMDPDGSNEWMLPPVRGDGQYITPAFHPDGRTLGFTVIGADDESGIFAYDIERECCLAYLSGGRWHDLGPTYSPDGLYVAFNTGRLGSAIPQVMVMPATGGQADMLSPYEYGSRGYFTAPDWSPMGDQVAFNGRIERRGRYHILVSDLEDRGRVLRQLTFDGNNESPSWAPNGRHIVFRGVRDWGQGLMIVDTVTGRIRHLLSGRVVDLPDWSPRLPGE